MVDSKTDEISSSLSETFGSKLNKYTIQSNRSLVTANQQLRIQLAFAKADISRLQNEIVDLQKRIAQLESTSDEERIEMIVRKRLKQRVEHLKSITHRTMQYMKKTKEDFDHAASRLDHTLSSSNLFDDDICTGECSNGDIATSTCQTGDEIVGRRVQRQSALETVEEDIYGEINENDANVICDRNLIMSVSCNGSERSSSSYKSTRNSRRQTLYIKKEPPEFENVAEISFVEVSFPETNQTASSFLAQNDGGSAADDFSTERATPTTRPLPGTPILFSESEKLSTCSRSELIPKTTHHENTPVKKRSELVMSTKMKRKISTNETPKRCKMNSESNMDATKETKKWLKSPTSTPSDGILSATNLNESFRCRRAAAAKISSFKEPSLVTKMRNPNVN